MNIINAYPESLGKRELYKITKAQNVRKMSEAAGSVLNPSAWVIYEDLDNKTGEMRTVLTVVDNGEYFGTISKTFIKEFMDMCENFDNNPGAIMVVGGLTKAGRDFITCQLA